MKRKELTELRGKSAADLAGVIARKRIDLDKAILGITTQTEKNLKKAKNLKKDLAQLLTIEREKQLK